MFLLDVLRISSFVLADPTLHSLLHHSDGRRRQMPFQGPSPARKDGESMPNKTFRKKNKDPYPDSSFVFQDETRPTRVSPPPSLRLPPPPPPSPSLLVEAARLLLPCSTPPPPEGRGGEGSQPRNSKSSASPASTAVWGGGNEFPTIRRKFHQTPTRC